MEDMIVNPVHWSAEYLISHGADVIHELALRSAGTLTSYRLLLGRCLLAVERTKLYERFPCSSTIHYACLTLGLRKYEARTLRRVANRLEGLPRLSVAAELGQVPWGKLREIVRKASAETEEFWLDLAHRMSYHDVERLVRATAFGKLPWEENDQPVGLDARLHLCVSAETNEMLKRAVDALSRKMEKALSPAEALEHLLIEHLAKNPVTPEVAKAAKKEADRDVAAAKCGRAKLVLKAWELSQDFRAGHSQDSALESALGGHPIIEEDPQEQLAQHVAPTAAVNAALEELETSVVRGVDDTHSDQQRPARTKANGCDGPISNEPHARTEADGCDGSISNQPPAGVGLLDAGCQAPDEVGLATSTTSGPSPRGQIVLSAGKSSDERILLTTLMRELTDRPISPEFREALERQDWKNGRLNFNPKARLATLGQRRELMRRDGYCCATPGCPNHTWLELHHVVWVSDDGETVTYNLVTLCSGCHRNVHKGLLKIKGDADKALTFRDAEGRDLARAYGLRAAGWLNLWVGWCSSAGSCYMQRWAIADGLPPRSADNQSDTTEVEVPAVTQ